MATLSLKQLRNKKGQFVKGINASPETQFKKGMKPWNKGIKLGKNPEHSLRMTGCKLSTETKEKMRQKLLGRKPSEETKRKISIAHQGKPNYWNRGKESKLWKGGKPKCIDCGKQLTQYKSKKCSEHRGLKGKNNPNWKGGLRGEDYLARRRFRSMMQKSIFERDNYVCQMCGDNKDLQVDHIQSWAEYVELRFSMDNCRTVCAKCHYQITFGKEMPETVKGWGHNLLRRVNP